MKIWSLGECVNVFTTSILQLEKQKNKKEFLVWDKDDKPALDFVTACANIRSHIFSIPKESRFNVKGNY